jgi:hypothetical protein
LYYTGSRNTLFSVTFNLSSNSVICTFFNQQTSTKICQIEYGSKQEGCNTSLSSKNTLDSNIVSIGLPYRFFSNGYCFKVKGYDGTHTAFMEGTYNPGDVNTVTCNVMSTHSLFLGPHQVPGDLPNTIVIVIIVMSLISSGSIAIVIVLIPLTLVRVHKRIQNPQSTCVNNAIYEEPDRHINTDQTIIAISDNVAYSVTHFQESQANI